MTSQDTMMNDKRTTSDALIEAIEARIGTGEPFTYGELCFYAAARGGDEGKDRLCDKTIQRWRRKGRIEMHGRSGRAPLWRLVAAAEVQS